MTERQKWPQAKGIDDFASKMKKRRKRKVSLVEKGQNEEGGRKKSDNESKGTVMKKFLLRAKKKSQNGMCEGKPGLRKTKKNKSNCGGFWGKGKQGRRLAS